jgi:hypothetical protein
MKTTLLAGVAVLFLATGTAHAAEIPKQYRGLWCQTKWNTIWKRCPDGELEIARRGWGMEDEDCALTAIRKSKYGGHILFGKCRGPDDPEGGTHPTEERWWLGSNNMRLQIIGTIPVAP